MVVAASWVRELVVMVFAPEDFDTADEIAVVMQSEDEYRVTVAARVSVKLTDGVSVEPGLDVVIDNADRFGTEPTEVQDALPATSTVLT